MKRIKSMNGYTIYQANKRDVAKYNFEENTFYIYFSSDIRDYGIEFSYPEFEAIETIEICEELCGNNFAIAKEICEELNTCVSMEQIEEVEKQLDNENSIISESLKYQFINCITGEILECDNLRIIYKYYDSHCREYGKENIKANF